MIEVKIAMDTLRKAMREDSDYAHSWHCNLACVQQDCGVDYEISNKAAARFMKLAFDVDTGVKK